MESSVILAAGTGSIKQTIAPFLREKGYDVDTAPNAESALRLAASRLPTLVLIDLNTTDDGGCLLISRIRSWSKMPIVVIGDDENDLIEALSAGADACLTRDRGQMLLLALIEANLRRRETLPESHLFCSGELQIDFAAGTVMMRGETVELTPTEYHLLCLLARNPDKLLTHEMLMTEIWGGSGKKELSSLRVFMTTLRRKLDVPGRMSMIRTHTGIGYRLTKID